MSCCHNHIQRLVWCDSCSLHISWSQSLPFIKQHAAKKRIGLGRGVFKTRCNRCGPVFLTHMIVGAEFLLGASCFNICWHKICWHNRYIDSTCATLKHMASVILVDSDRADCGDGVISFCWWTTRRTHFRPRSILCNKKTIGLRRLGCPVKSWCPVKRWCPVKCPIKVQLLHPFAEQPEKEAFNKSKLTKVLLFLLNCQPIVWYFYAIFYPFWHFLVILGKVEKTKMLSWSPLLKHCAPHPPLPSSAKYWSFVISYFFMQFSLFHAQCSPCFEKLSSIFRSHQIWSNSPVYRSQIFIVPGHWSWGRHFG